MNEPQIAPMMAIIESSAYVSDALWAATLLSVIAGALAKRWWHGLAAAGLLLAAFFAFALLRPVFVFGSTLYLPPISGIWRETSLLYALLFAAFIIPYGVRWLIRLAWAGWGVK